MTWKRLSRVNFAFSEEFNYYLLFMSCNIDIVFYDGIPINVLRMKGLML